MTTLPYGVSMKRTIAVIIFILAVILFATLVANRALVTMSGNKLPIAASFYPIGYFAQEVAGDHATVTIITPAGAEPHDYEPSTGDMAAMERAKLVILSGGGLEPWGDQITSTLASTNTLVVTVGEGLATRQITEDGSTDTDPHIWLDPMLAKQQVRAIRLALAEVDPSHGADYERNEQVFAAKLDALDEAYRVGLAECQSQAIVASHASFGYLADRYGLTQVAIAGLSPDAEPSPSVLGDVANFVKANHVSYIFFESLVSPKLAETIAEETGAKTLELNPIEGLTDADRAAGKSYLDAMYANLTNLKIALQCQINA